MPHRYFTTEIGSGRAALTGSDAHHLADVMRGRVGDTVILCDANAVEYTGTITSVQPGRVEFSVSEGYPSAAEPDVQVTLYVGYPKQGKLEDIIRHSVELGVHRVEPLLCGGAQKRGGQAGTVCPRGHRGRQAVRQGHPARGQPAAARFCLGLCRAERLRPRPLLL